MPILQKGTGSPSSGDYVTLDKILEWREEKERVIPKKTIFDKESFHSEPDCAVESPKRISVIARVNPSEKTKLIGYIDERMWHELHEGDSIVEATPIDCVWIETLDFAYRRVEHMEKYWLASIGLICSACVSGTEIPISQDEMDWGYFKVEGEVWFNEETGGFLGNPVYFPDPTAEQGGGYWIVY